MFKLKGHSGCKLELHEISLGNRYVRKISKSEEYNERLRKQCEKQEHFKRAKRISTPKILRKGKVGGLFFFDMEYVGGQDFIEFTSTCQTSSIEEVAETLIRFVQKSLKKSNYIDFPEEKYKNKALSTLESVVSQEKITKKESSTLVEFLLDRDFDAPFPEGYCHGDLTFSNVIASSKNERLTFIDFLDQPFNSPIHDIVKIRQDSFYNWSLNLYSGNVDSTKVKIAWRHIDDLVVESFFSDKSVVHYYDILQVLNFLRILNYTTEDSMTRFVLECMWKTIEKRRT